MAETVNAEFGGKSKYEVAKDMAYLILRTLEDKEWKQVGRAEYLKTVYECMWVLNGNPPSSAASS